MACAPASRFGPQVHVCGLSCVEVLREGSFLVKSGPLKRGCISTIICEREPIPKCELRGALRHAAHSRIVTSTYYGCTGQLRQLEVRMRHEAAWLGLGFRLELGLGLGLGLGIGIGLGLGFAQGYG